MEVDKGQPPKERKMKENVFVVLKVKLGIPLKFVEKDRARLFDKKEMEIFIRNVSSYVNCGCDIKVEKEIEK